MVISYDCDLINGRRANQILLENLKQEEKEIHHQIKLIEKSAKMNKSIILTNIESIKLERKELIHQIEE